MDKTRQWTKNPSLVRVKVLNNTFEKVYTGGNYRIERCWVIKSTLLKRVNSIPRAA
jgi:hypothetical protein